MTVGLGLLFLVVSEAFHLDTHPALVWAGLLVIVFGGAVAENAIRFDAMTGQPVSARPAASATIEPGSASGLTT